MVILGGSPLQVARYLVDTDLLLFSESRCVQGRMQEGKLEAGRSFEVRTPGVACVTKQCRADHLMGGHRLSLQAIAGVR